MPDEIEQPGTGQQPGAPRVFATLKVPPFWPDNINLWFAQIESQFRLYDINDDDVKFNHIVANLDGKVLQYVSGAVISPPENDKYANIKGKIIDCFADSSQKKLEKLMSDLTLGNQKPSQLLNRQRDLGGTTISEDFLKSLWLRQLPINVQSILAAHTGSLNEMAQLADKIVEVGQPSSSGAFSVTNYEATIATLTNKVADLESKLNSRQSRSPHRNRSKSSRRSESEVKKFDKCWYHRKFGDDATKCRPPCAAKKN